MGNDPEFIKRMAALGERATQEHYLHGQEQQQATTQSIRGEINKLMNGGRNSAYHDPMHADHNNAVNYVRQLYEKLY